jgi:hypothetical protein
LPAARIIYGDAVEAALWVRVTERAAALRVQMMKAEASHIAAAVSRLFRSS